MEKYHFSRYLSKEEKKWILECIDYVHALNIPISNNIYFKHCKNFKEIGWCETEEGSKKAECTIALSIYLNIHPESYEIDFKETCIHELLHTINNKSKDPHKGSWGSTLNSLTLYISLMIRSINTISVRSFIRIIFVLPKKEIKNNYLYLFFNF